MKKLSNLKKWLTLPEAAAYMSLIIGEPVSENDILFFALNSSLQLSVDLVNGSRARRGTVVDADQSVIERHNDDVVPLSPTSNLVLEDKLLYIRGLFELPLYGQEEIALLSKFHTETKGPKVNLIANNGVFVSRGEDVYQLYDYFDSMPGVVGSKAFLKEKQDQAENHPDEEMKRRAETALSHYEEERKEILKHVDALPEWRECCIPAHKIPEDIVLMVHKDDLDEFLESKCDADSEAAGSEERPLRGKERSNYLNLIGALADLYWKTAYPDQEYSQVKLLADLEKYDGFPGMRDRNLKEKLTLAMRAITQP